MAVDSKTLQIIIAAKDATGPAFSSAQKASAVAGIAMMGAGLAVAGALNAAADQAVAYGGEVVDIQRLTGLAAEESSKWAAILDRYGVSGKSAGMVIKSLDNAIVGHNKALEAAGIATQNADGTNRDATAVLADLADYYSKATDKTAAAALAGKVLGKGYMALLPILANGAAGIDDVTESAMKAGLILGQDSVDAVKKYSKALKDNEEAEKGLEVQTGLMVLPIKTSLVQALGNVLGWFEKLSPAWKQAIVLGAELSAGALIIGGALMTLGLVSAAATTAMAATAVSFGGTAIGAVAAAYAVGGLSAAVETLNAAVALGPIGLVALAGAIGLAVGAAIDQIPAIKQGQQTLGDYIANLTTLTQYQQSANTEWGASAATQATMAKMYDATTGKLTPYGEALKANAAQTAKAKAEQNGLTVAADGTTKAYEAQKLVLSVSRTKLEELTGNIVAAHQAEKAKTDYLKNGGKRGTAEYNQLVQQASDAQKLAAQTASVMSDKQINAAVKAGILSKAQGTLAKKANDASGKVDGVSQALDNVPNKTTAALNVVVHDGPLQTLMSTLGNLGGGIGTLAISMSMHGAHKAAGDIVAAHPGGSPAIVAENGYNETLMNWAPANRARNLALLAATVRGGAFGSSPAFAFSGAGQPSGTASASDGVSRRMLAVLERLERDGVAAFLDGRKVSRGLGVVTTTTSRSGGR